MELVLEFFKKDSFTRFFVQLIAGAFLLGMLIVFGFWFLFSKKEIKSTEKIIPTWELVVEDDVVDTIWVYKK